MAEVHLHQLTKHYGEHVAVRGVDLTIADGELLVIVGPSGCGKTSVLRMVAGLEAPTGGSVLVDGSPVTDVHRRDRRLAMMFQDATLYPHMTVEQNIGFPLKMAGTRRSAVDREVARLAETLGIGGLLGRRPSQLSGGQQQRVAMARALIRRPELLLMDEPMSNLDAKLRGELRATIAHLQHELDITTLYVTHDQLEAMSLGDRIALMRDGEIVQLGPPAELYHDPADVFVATFIGSPTMNLFAATVGSDADGVHLTTRSASWHLGADWDDSLRELVGTTVVTGVRPQACRFTGEGAVVDVEHMELIGDRWEIEAVLDAPPFEFDGSGVSIGTGHTRLTIEVPADRHPELELWRPSHVVIDSVDLHLFDPDSGTSLRRQHTGRAPQLVRATT